MTAYSVQEKPAFSCLPHLQKEVIKEINLARQNPKQYAEYIKEFKKNYDGKKFKRAGKKTIETQEGVSVANEAVQYLQNVLPQPPLVFTKGLSFGARDHIINISSTGVTGHEGDDGSLPGERVNRYGAWEEAIGENICYGFDSAREIVMWLIIDDSMSDRSHRVNIFRPQFQKAGVWVCEHPLYDFICVITLFTHNTIALDTH